MPAKNVTPATVTVDAKTARVTEEKPAEKVVNGLAVSKGPGTGLKPFKWNKRKKQALKAILDGKTVVQTAKELGVSRQAINKWKSHPAWNEEMAHRLQEMQISSKLKRVRATTAITDKLAMNSAALLQAPAEKVDVARTGLMLRTHLEYTRAERELFGEGHEDNPAHHGVTIVLGGVGPNAARDVEPEEAGTARLAFEEFMSKYDPDLGVVASSPQEAAALIGEKVLQETALIDTIREEDRQVLRSEAEEEQERKR